MSEQLRMFGEAPRYIKALTLTQPWATLTMLKRGDVAEKSVETRDKLFKHRGLLAIHASLSLDEAWRTEPFASVLRAHGYTRPDSFPYGAVLGTVTVVDGCRFTRDEFPHCLPVTWHGHIGAHEKYFGDYRAGRAGLLLRDSKPFDKPIKARGMNGLWNWDPPPTGAA